MAELANFLVKIGSQFDDKGIKKANTSLDKIKKIAGVAAKGLGALAVAGAAMGTALVIAAKKAADAAGIQEKAEIALAQAMKTAGTYTEEAFRHNLSYASALQKITTYGDETILVVQKLLTNYGAQGEELDGLTKATLDFATATGMDLQGAAALVGKTIGSTTNALTRYGITVEGGVGSTERMKSAVEGISKLFGGAAQAETQTYAGRVQQLTNRWGDLVEKIGFKVIPIFEEIIKFINDDILPSFEDWIEDVNLSKESMNKFADTLKEMKNKASDFIDILKVAVVGVRAWSEINTLSFKKGFQSVKEFFAAYKAYQRGSVDDTEKSEKKRSDVISSRLKERVDNLRNAVKDEEEIESMSFAKRAAMYKTYTDAVSNFFEKFVNFQNVEIENTKNRDIDAATARYNAEKDRINNTILDETERTTLLQELEEGFQAEIDNIKDIAEREEKKRREALKPILIAKAVANTAVAVTEALPNLILSALVAAAGAAEVATIQAQKFAKGVKGFSGGMALVGEEGPELLNLPRGSDVIPAPETKGILAGAGNTYNVTINMVAKSRRMATELGELAGQGFWRTISKERRL